MLQLANLETGKLKHAPPVACRMTRTMANSKISTARAIATDPQLWLPLVVLAIGIGVLALVK
jgi:hypothetical protein